MEDLTKNKMITKNKISKDLDWNNISYYLYIDMNEDIYVIGRIHDILDFCIFKSKIEDFDIEEVKKLAKFYNERKELIHIFRFQPLSLTILNYDFPQQIIFLDKFKEIPSKNDIKKSLDKIKNKAKFYTEIIDWKSFSDKLDKIDELSKNRDFQNKYYPDLSEFNCFNLLEFGCLLFSEDEFVKEQHKRLITHYFWEYQYKNALEE